MGMLKICIVANKRDLKENYSNFVDSCDIVVRINKMDNLHSGLAGTKTDIVFTTTCGDYFKYSRKFRNVDVLRKAEVFFTPQKDYIIKQYVNRECIKNYHILKPDSKTERWTTTSKAVRFFAEKFPNEHIYFLGDVGRRKRTPGTMWHNKPGAENVFFDILIKQGVLVPILGNPDFINK